MKKSAYLGWAIGSFTSASLINTVSLLHLRFMTDSLGIAIGVAGTLTVMAKIYDAATDPLMGVISDHTKTRWGRFRPYLLIGGLIAAISLIMLFNVPHSLTGFGIIAFVGVSLLIFSTAYTMYRIPYLAIGRELTQDFDERSRLMACSVYGSSLGSLASTSAAPFLLAEMGSDRDGHGQIALILAALVAIGSIVTFSLLKEKQDNPTEQAGTKAVPKLSAAGSWAALKSNRPFLCLIGFKVTLFAGLTLHGAALPYFTRHVLGVSDKMLGSIFLASSIAMMASQPLWIRFARRFGRRNGLIAAALIATFSNFAWFFVPASSPTPWVQLLGFITGVSNGGIFMGLYTVLTDTMDYSKRTQGENRTGTLAGIFVMVEKGTAALGTFMFSMVLAFFGFVSTRDAHQFTQSPETMSAIVIAFSILPGAITLLACLFMMQYRLPRYSEEAIA